MRTNAPRFRLRTAALLGAILLTVASVAGCQGGLNRRSSFAADPVVIDDGASGGSAFDAAPRRVTWVQRHPLFFQPVEWYQRANNPVVGVIQGAVIGVPVGVVGEARQIIVGCPVRP